MKQKVWSFLMVFFLLAGLIACNNEDDVKQPEEPQKGTTYMSVSLRMPQQSGLRASDDNNYNAVGTYPGKSQVVSLDLYLLSSDGATILDSRRLAFSDLAYVANTAGAGTIALEVSTPFKTVPGDKKMLVIINSPYALSTTVPDSNYCYTVNGSLPLSTLAKVDPNNKYDGVNPANGTDIVTFTGMSSVFTIQDGISAAEVISSKTNMVNMSVIRIPSRVIVTNTAPSTVVDTSGVTLGTLSNITYSVAQGANSVYMFPKSNGTNTVTWGYDYMPGTDYQATAGTYYDYSDLNNTTDTIPVFNTSLSPNALEMALITLPGKFLLENTHPLGTNATNSGYRKGNTAYVLVRATFTPDPAQIVDGGAIPTGNTFYVGGTTGKIYSSITAAQAPPIGATNQPVTTYLNGKVLYYAWLNPDVISKPVNSPVIRNNIYHISITKFKSIGVNWNPLNPGVNNPDPNPDPNGPANPIVPTDPLTSTDTYMSADINVLFWTVHSYGIEL